MEREEVLTAEEADALLKRVEGDELPAGGSSSGNPGGVDEVDITQWDRIVRGRVPALESVNERFVGLARIGLFQLFRRSVEISAEQVTLLRWGEYADSLKVPTSLNLVNSDAQNTVFLTTFDADLVFEFVEIYFGGTGGAARKPDVGEFTLTEQRLIRNVMSQLIEYMIEAWSPFLQTRMSVVRNEINPQFAAIAAPTEPVFVTRFHVEIGGHGGEMHVALPSAMVDPVRHLVNVGSLREAGDKEFWKSSLQEEVQEASVSLRTVIADMTMDLGELMNLKPGDVIPVELPSTVLVLAGDSQVLKGTFGVSRGYNAVKVTEIAQSIADNGSIFDER